MIQSRCGIKCNECEYQESQPCKGCVNVVNPFWGECSVKGCCESKELNNCGECLDFSCELLNKFAYDKEQGDKGKRIEQCKKWCNKEIN